MNFELRPWTHPDNYMGPRWEGWFIHLSQHRDSEILVESNFNVAVAAFEKLPEVKLVGDDVMPDGDTRSFIVVRDAHWAVGWNEWIAIHPSNKAAMALAEAQCARLNNYPILDEMDVSERENDSRNVTWAGMRIKDRLEAMKRYAPEVPILAARHPWVPDNNGHLDEYLTGE